MGTFLPSNILLIPWPSASTMLSSRATHHVCLGKMGQSALKWGSMENKTTNKSLFFLYFCLKDKICIFCCFLRAHQLQKSPRHAHNRVVRCFRNISFRSYDGNKFSVPKNFNIILFWCGEWQSIPIKSPIPEVKFLLKIFLFSSLTEAGRAGCGFVYTNLLSFFFLDWKWDFFHCIFSFWSSAF